MTACYYQDSSWKEDTRLADEMRNDDELFNARFQDRRLRHFGILYTDKTVSLNEVREAVAK